MRKKINIIKQFYQGDEWVVDFVFNLLENRIDIIKSRDVTWGNVFLRKGTITLPNNRGESVQIALNDGMSSLLQNIDKEKFVFEKQQVFFTQVEFCVIMMTGHSSTSLIEFYNTIKYQEVIAQLKIDQKKSCDFKVTRSKMFPPEKLRFRVSGEADKDIFYYSGAAQSFLVVNLLEKHSCYNKEHLLDWGCGCGRVAIHLINQFPEINYTGCDIDSECIRWCKQNLSENPFFINDFNPPLPFRDKQFTIIFATSVMTHLDEKAQQLWLKEIHRILQPNGLFLATTLGETSAKVLGEAEQFATVEYLDRTSNAIDGIAPKGKYKDTFQTKEYTYKNWTKYFDILEYKKSAIGHQDLVVMRKKKNESSISRHS